MRIDGTVKFFNQTRGFGFITPDKVEKDLFVHGSVESWRPPLASQFTRHETTVQAVNRR